MHLRRQAVSPVGRTRGVKTPGSSLTAPGSPSLPRSDPGEAEEEREFGALCPDVPICVYQELKGRARLRGWIGYEELNQSCGLGLSLGTDQGRNLIGRFVGAVSEYEVSKGRPMLSAVVVHKQSPREPGPGFYKLADELGQRRSGETDRALWFRILNQCHEYWGLPR